ncbi:hypothetical protein ACWCHM_29450 [Micromonospora sp. SCSIO 07396]
MSTGCRQTALLVVILILPALLAFGGVRLLGTRDSGEREAEPPLPSSPVVPSHPVIPSGAVDSGPDIDLSARITGTRHGTELTFLISRDRAAVGPPPQIRDCRRFAEWAVQNGGIPTGFEPIHTLSMHARRNVDVSGVSATVVPIAKVQLTEQDGPFAELACRDDTPAPTATRRNEDEALDRPHVLTAGQTIELSVPLKTSYDTGETFPHGVVDYQLKVRIEIDGAVREHLLRNGSAPFRCCGRTTAVGYKAARYEWRLAPVRSLRYCAELRYPMPPPPEECAIRQR